MAKYKIEIEVEIDEEYSNSNQIEDLVNDLTYVVADYNCFYQVGDTKVFKEIK
jgi:hypothetical protein